MAPPIDVLYSSYIIFISSPIFSFILILLLLVLTVSLWASVTLFTLFEKRLFWILVFVVIYKIDISLSKNLMAVVRDALKTNITTLVPLVLPLSEQLLFFATVVVRTLFKMKVKPYIPGFKLAFEHCCIHARGRAVLDELEKNLQLSEWPSRMTL